ncbi:hypothetical protein FACS1894156_3270 [Bacteroidia bacterium]|nr:hypothetical protein FACS1894156_3270 [Bacteroidia bacterium]
MKKNKLVKIQTIGEHTYEPMSIVCAIPPYESSLAQKIYFCILNKLSVVRNDEFIQYNLFGNENVLTKVLIYISEIGETHYNRIKEAADQLANSKLTWTDKDKKDFKIFSPFPSIQYKQRTGIIEITINQDMLSA